MLDIEQDNTNVIEAPIEEDAPLLPDGWTDKDDIFSDTWGSATADTSVGEISDEITKLFADEAAPTTEQSDPGAQTDAESAQTETETPAAQKLRFKAQYNHEDMDVELDETELPTIYQKSLALDKTRERLDRLSPTVQKMERLAKTMGYDNVDAMLDSAATSYRQAEIDRLIADGVHKAVAEDIVDRRISSAVKTDKPTETQAADKPAEAQADKPTQSTAHTDNEAPAGAKQEKVGRDWRSEADELIKLRPQLRGKSFPKAVQDMAEKEGKPLAFAYLEWESAQNKAEIERLKRANRTHEQNAASAARAPVTAVTRGGATDTSPEDPFLAGFNADGW